MGHSLGGAIATLAATNLRNSGLAINLVWFPRSHENQNTNHADKSQYTFGSPRVGNLAIAKYVTNQNKGANYRIMHNKDPVTQLPFQWMGYYHHSPEYWITSGNNVAVTTSDLKICTGVGNSSCNAGINYFKTVVGG